MALKDTIEKVKETAKKLGVSDNTINTVENVTKTVANAMADAKKSSNSESSNANGTTVTGTGNDMVIHPKESSGSRLSKYSNGGLGTSTNYGTYEQDLNRLTAAQRQAQVDQLKAAKKKALANLDVQEQNIKPMYENARNQTSAASQQGARNFAEYLANRGLTNSGAAAQAEINRQSALTNNLGNINTAEANAYRDIANQRTAVENGYVSDLANANNALTNQYYNNLLNYNEQQRQMVQALQNQALGQYAGDYQAYKNSLLAQGYDPNSLEVLSVDAARGSKVANNVANANTTANALASIEAGNINYNNAAALGWTLEQAQNYYNAIQAQKLAQAQEAQRKIDWETQQYNDKLAQQDFENNIALGKLANETAKANWESNKPYNTTVYHASSGGGNNNGTKTNYLSLKEATDYIGKSENPKATANALAEYGYIDESTWNMLYDINGWNI